MLSLAVPALAAGCGADRSGEPPDTVKATPAADGSIGVTLTEYKISDSTDTAPAGRVTFAVANDGAIPHELVVVRTPRRAAALGKGSEADEHGAVGELDQHALRVGASGRLSLDLSAGHYALICNLPGHYQGGMHTDFTVT